MCCAISMKTEAKCYDKHFAPKKIKTENTELLKAFPAIFF